MSPAPRDPDPPSTSTAASRGNPGEAGFGVYVTTPEGAAVAELYGYLGRASNNVAEYQALIHAPALRPGARGAAGARLLRLRAGGAADRGRYRVKHPDMIPLHREARALCARFDEAAVSHVRREQNKDADRLANQALDEKASKLRLMESSSLPTPPGSSTSSPRWWRWPCSSSR